MKTFLRHGFMTAPLAAIIGFSVVIPLIPAEARITFKAPAALGVPGRRVAGASRTMQQCLLDNKPLTAIVPQSNIGLTTAANPVLLFYIPKTSAQAQLELVVQTANEKNIVTKQSYKPSSKAGVVSIPLTNASLEVGKDYHWFFSIVCNPKARSKDHLVHGGIKRIQAEPPLTTQLKNASPQQVVNVYAQAGIWQDSVAKLAGLRYSRPNDAELKADWEGLLQSVEFKPDVVNAPLLQGGEAPQQQ
ncbi:DUF928 domain-containing protein [Brasilonema bromeliae]|uniref:DUF928 domain-containing protein n=1 Tax=Brasilonema bromeliae SPC951 TaxID=385972 RepID=A0ABX1P8W5_9CYAN|nr:DUF928 domain-containing protein [Brasilonema bromeliae]NMG20892.1 hypothetical protein [Brasilonema bromeliae SPC951]